MSYVKNHKVTYDNDTLLIFTTAMKGLFTHRATGCTVSATEKGQELWGVGKEGERENASMLEWVTFK